MPTKRKSGKPEMLSRDVEIKQEFDVPLARMQTSKARRGMKVAFTRPRPFPAKTNKKRI